MTDRVNNYSQLPVSKELLEHMRDEIGLVGVYKQIFDDLRDTRGSTQVHADNVGLPVRQYNLMAGIVGQACVHELIRLAEIGLKSS